MGRTLRLSRQKRNKNWKSRATRGTCINGNNLQSGSLVLFVYFTHLGAFCYVPGMSGSGERMQTCKRLDLLLRNSHRQCIVQVL